LKTKEKLQISLRNFSLIRAEIDGMRNLVETARGDSRLFAAERSLLRALANSFSIIGRKRKFE